MSGRPPGWLQDSARRVMGPVVNRLWNIEVSGREHIPEQGPALLAPNHISFVDSMFFMAILRRRALGVGKAEYMDSWKTRHIFPAIGMIPLDRSGGSASQGALDQAEASLGRGDLFVIFPEGTRSRDGQLHRGRTGVARLALETGAPIVPVGIVGTDLIQPPDAPRPKLRMTCEYNVGRPIDVSRYRDQADNRMLLRQITDEVMFEIRELSGQTYVDAYAGAAQAA